MPVQHLQTFKNCDGKDYRLSERSFTPWSPAEKSTGNSRHTHTLWPESVIHYYYHIVKWYSPFGIHKWKKAVVYVRILV